MWMATSQGDRLNCSFVHYHYNNQKNMKWVNNNKTSTVVQNPRHKCTEQYCCLVLLLQVAHMHIILLACHTSTVTTRVHIACDCIICSSITVVLCQQFIAAKKAFLQECYNQWWAGRLIGCIANYIMYLPFELKRSHCQTDRTTTVTLWRMRRGLIMIGYCVAMLVFGISGNWESKLQ